MTPDTVHLVAQLIRHQRALMTSIEKWVSKQEPCRTTLELLAVTGMQRQILDSFEWQLSRVDVAQEEVESRNPQDRAPAFVTTGE